MERETPFERPLLNFDRDFVAGCGYGTEHKEAGREQIRQDPDRVFHSPQNLGACTIANPEAKLTNANGNEEKKQKKVP